MTNSLETTGPSGSYWVSTHCPASNTTDSYTFIWAVRPTSNLGAGQFQAFSAFSDNTSHDIYELYQSESGSDIYLFWKDSAAGDQNVLLRASALNTWTHIAFIKNGASGGHLYVIDENFSLGSPSFLIDTAISVRSIANDARWAFCETGGGDRDGTVAVGHEIVYSSALSQADVLGQFKQRAATNSPGVPFCSYENSFSNPVTSGMVGVDATGNNNGSTNAITGNGWNALASEPGDWSGGPPPVDSFPFGAKRQQHNSMLFNLSPQAKSWKRAPGNRIYSLPASL